MSNANTKLHSSVDELFSIVKVKMKLLIIYEKNAIFNFFFFSTGEETQVAQAKRSY